MAKGPGVRRPPQAGYGRGFSSNADMFSKLGDPWVSPRQQAEDFNRREYENPDLDQYTRAHRSDRELEGVVMDIQRISIHQRNESADVKAARLAKEAKELRQRKLLAVSIRMHKKMRGEIK